MTGGLLKRWFDELWISECTEEGLETTHSSLSGFAQALTLKVSRDDRIMLGCITVRTVLLDHRKLHKFKPELS
jgi:hypothetical protein